jgi:hypothetical protein
LTNPNKGDIIYLVEKREVTEEELKYLTAVDEAIKRAAVVMELGDIEEDESSDDFDSIYEERFHCGTCMVRTVLDEIWPDLSNLMDFYERKTP